MFKASEILFLACLGILLVGPKRLPEIMRQFARVLLSIRQVKAELEAQVSRELASIASETESAAGMSKSGVRQAFPSPVATPWEKR